MDIVRFIHNIIVHQRNPGGGNNNILLWRSEGGTGFNGLVHKDFPNNDILSTYNDKT